jgi:hypothetical protein
MMAILNVIKRRLANGRCIPLKKGQVQFPCTGAFVFLAFFTGN